MEININEKALTEVYQRIAGKIEAVDKELRSRFTSSDVQIIKSKARQALALIGVTLPDSDLDSYSQSIADDIPYQIILN